MLATMEMRPAQGHPTTPPSRASYKLVDTLGYKIAATATEWLGTHWRHGGQTKAAGVDALGFVWGVVKEALCLEGRAPKLPADWKTPAKDGEPLIEFLEERFAPVMLSRIEVGDILVFRMNEGAAVTHCAIYMGESLRSKAPVIAHAYWARAATESRLEGFWDRYLVGAYRAR